MGFGIPLIHRIQQYIRLMNRQHWAFGNDVQVFIGNQGGNFDDDILLRLQPGHFQIHPHQIFFLTHKHSPFARP